MDFREAFGIEIFSLPIRLWTRSATRPWMRSRWGMKGSGGDETERTNIEVSGHVMLDEHNHNGGSGVSVPFASIPYFLMTVVISSGRRGVWYLIIFAACKKQPCLDQLNLNQKKTIVSTKSTKRG